MNRDFDVIIVGAGFAGAAAARECATRGLRTLVLEGRDRIGGRTRTSALSNGDLVDIGGTYVHWSQPHIWSEITRYGFEDDLLDNVERLDAGLVPRNGGLEWCDAAELPVRERSLMNKFFENSRQVFPYPYQPFLRRDAVAAIDGMSIQDRLDELDISEDDKAYLSRFLTMEAQRTPSEAGYLYFMRVWATAGHEAVNAMEALYGKRLRHGTKSVLDAMLADGGADVRLGTRVTAIARTDHGVTVSTAHGDSFTASAAVVATPAGVWPYLDFSPALSPDRKLAAQEGLQAPQGNKIVAVLRGEPRNIFVLARGENPIGIIWTSQRRSKDEQVVEVFDTPAMKDARDHDEIRMEILKLLPHVEIVEILSETFDLDDEFTRGSWPYVPRGAFLRHEAPEKLSQPEGRVAFACSEIARGWSGFIDGAIESGLRAARQVHGYAESDRTA